MVPRARAAVVTPAGRYEGLGYAERPPPHPAAVGDAVPHPAMGPPRVGSACARLDRVGRRAVDARGLARRRAPAVGPRGRVWRRRPDESQGTALARGRDLSRRPVDATLARVAPALAARVAGRLATMQEHKQLSPSSLVDAGGEPDRPGMGDSRSGDVVTLGGLIGRLLYGGLFVVVVPLSLAAWAISLEPVVPLGAAHAPRLGALVAVAGLVLLGLGIVDLITRGQGLPMNAFPPRVFVRSGIYRWLRNPIYVGFGLLMTGVSLVTASAAGLWVVTPVTVLAMLALVWGYERHDLLARFGPAGLEAPLLSLPRAVARRPSAAERAAVYLWVMVPWLIAYFSVQALGPAPDAFSLALPFELAWPVVQWTEALYVSAYLFVPTAPLLALSARGLRRLAVSGAAGTIVVTLLWLVVPVTATNRPFDADGVLGQLLAWEQATSRGVAAFPAFHVLWALLVAELWADNGRVSGRPVWPVLGWTWAVAIAASTLTTGMHTLLEVIAAVVLFVPLRDPDATLESIRQATERLANSWREWRIGPVRVINYGAYAAAAAGVGTLVAGSALGANPEAVVWVGLCILVGAGAWAQWLEGSSRLLRPFGWYGGVLGATAGAFSAALAGVPLRAAHGVVCLRGAVHPDLRAPSLPRERLLPRRPGAAGPRHPLRAPAIARHADCALGRGAAASDTALFDRRQRRDWPGPRAAPGARGRRRPDHRALPDPQRHRPIRRGVVPRRAADQRRCRTAHLPVAGRRPDAGGHRDDDTAERRAGRRLHAAIAAAAGRRRRDGTSGRRGDGCGLPEVEPALLAAGRRRLIARRGFHHRREVSAPRSHRRMARCLPIEDRLVARHLLLAVARRCAVS